MHFLNATKLCFFFTPIFTYICTSIILLYSSCTLAHLFEIFVQTFKCVCLFLFFGVLVLVHYILYKYMLCRMYKRTKQFRGMLDRIHSDSFIRLCNYMLCRYVQRDPILMGLCVYYTMFYIRENEPIRDAAMVFLYFTAYMPNRMKNK